MKKSLLFKYVSFLLILILPGFMLCAQDPDDWATDGGAVTASQNTTTIHGGISSCEITWTSQSNQYLNSLDFSVTEGATYDVSMWVYDNDAAGRARLCVTYDVGSTYFGSYSADGTSWEQIVTSVTVPAGATTASIQIRFYDISASWLGVATVIVDDVSFTLNSGSELVLNPGFENWPGGQDTDPPVWTANYPYAINVVDNKATLVVNMDEAGVAYYIVVYAGSTVPTAAQVKAGVNYDTVNVFSTGNIIVEAANTDYFEVIEGAIPEVSYDIWVVAEDGSLNLQSTPVMINITTTPARTLSFVKPQDKDTYYLGDAITFEWTSANIDSILIGAYIYEDDEIFPLTADQETGELEPVFADLGSWSFVIPPGADVDSIDLLIYDYYDTSFYDRVYQVYLIDTLTPKIDELAPANGSSTVPAGASFTITFDEEVFTGTGNFYLRAEDGTLIETFDIAGLTIYYNEIILTPSLAIESGKTYYIDWDKGVVKDRKDLDFIGVTGDGAWKFTTGADLFFTEYIEGSGNNKALEIFNPTSGTVNLNNYRIAQSNNGSDWLYYHYFPENATIAAGEMWVILNDGTDPLLFDPANADEVLSYPSVVHHNGDDARGIEVTFDGGDSWTLIDVIGIPWEDPGTGWDVAGVPAATANHTLLRKITVARGNLDWTASAGTNTTDSEWLVADRNYFDNLGYPSPQGSDNTELEAIMIYDTLLNNVTVSSVIDSLAGTAAVEILFGLDSQLDSLVAMLTLAGGVTSSPASGDTLDFTNPVVFTVTAEDGITTRDWTVTVTVSASASSDAEILSFVIPNSATDAVIDSGAGTVTLTMPFGTDLTALVPDISISAGATVSPESGVAQDFSGDVVYTVTAQDGVLKDWTVTVTNEEALSASIYDIQYTTDASGDSPLNGVLVKTSGTITALHIYNGFIGYFIQDKEGVWNGVYVYDLDRDLTDNPQLGDSIVIVGTVDEYYTLTEIKNILEYTTISSGNSLPGPVEVATGSAGAEEYEGVFMNIHAATCTNPDLGYGEVEMDDGSGAVRLDDMLFAYDPFVLNNIYTITGVMHYSYSNWKLLPGSAADISDVTGIFDTGLSGEMSIYPNPNDGRFSIEIPAGMMGDIEISIMNVTGKLIRKDMVMISTVNIMNIDMSNEARGLYFIKLSDGTNTAIAKFMKQ